MPQVHYSKGLTRAIIMIYCPMLRLGMMALHVCIPASGDDDGLAGGEGN